MLRFFPRPAGPGKKPAIVAVFREITLETAPLVPKDGLI
jgi:hypothetical protein